MKRRKERKEKTGCRYSIKCTTPVDYELSVSIPLTNAVMKRIFFGARKALYAKGHRVPENLLESTDRFDVPRIYYNLLVTSMNSILKDLKENFKQDKIILVSIDLKKAEFMQENEKWCLMASFGGIYNDER